MAIPDPPKAGSPFCVLQTDGWNPNTPEINNFFIPEIALRGGYHAHFGSGCSFRSKLTLTVSLGVGQLRALVARLGGLWCFFPLQI